MSDNPFAAAPPAEENPFAVSAAADENPFAVAADPGAANVSTCTCNPSFNCKKNLAD